MATEEEAGRTAARLGSLAALDACVVSDALDAAGIEGACLGLRPLWAGAQATGRARTVELRPIAEASTDLPKTHLGVRAIERSDPGDVIVVANAGRVEMGAWGGLLSAAAAQRGVAGVVADGACRDVDEASDRRFPVFARAGITRTARGRVFELASGDPVMVAGVAVREGDYVRADGSGVVVIPAERIDEVLRIASEMALRERAMVAGIEAGRSLEELLGAGYELMIAQLQGTATGDATTDKRE